MITYVMPVPRRVTVSYSTNWESLAGGQSVIRAPGYQASGYGVPKPPRVVPGHTMLIPR